MTVFTTIAIDGPSASGKTTIAQLLAEQLAYLLLDTGCMYRATTLAVLGQGVDVNDETAVTQLAHTIQIDIQPATGHDDGRLYTTLLNGQDVTWDIRSPEVDLNVSRISSYPGVRQEMVQRQRLYGQRGHVVMVGRDIGTVVLPETPLKFYITASAEERARRRWQERQQQGYSSDYEAILADVVRRDQLDSNRQHSPLRPADDAIILDTTAHSPNEIVTDMLRRIEKMPVSP